MESLGLAGINDCGLYIPAAFLDLKFLPSKAELMKHIAAFVLFIFLIIPALAQANDEWYLISRHGSCAEINILERKVGDMSGVETPEDFIELMLSKGYEVEVNEPSNLEGNAVQVEVPEKSLSLMFVTRKLCKDFSKK